MPKVKLTDAAVKRYKAPAGGRIDYFDATLPGFALRVSGPTERSPEGRKSWALFYRFHGVQKRLTFQPVYPALGLADARRKAGNALALLSQGTDPAATAAKRAGDTMGAVVDQFIEYHCGTAARRNKKAWAPRYAEDLRRGFDNHVLPRWRNREISSITRRDINDLLDAVADEGTKVKDADGKRRHVKGGPISANRVLAAIRALFNWAVHRGIVDATPATGIEPRGQEQARERFLSDDEVRAVWPEFVARGYPFGHLYRLALLTGQRRDELAKMQWAEIEEKAGTWILAADRTKPGRAHVVPLSDAAMEILADAKKQSRIVAEGKNRKLGRYVFTTTGDTPVSGYSRAKAGLDKAIAARRKIDGRDPLPDWRFHDLRRTTATGLAGLGTARFVVSRILNHAQDGVTAIYDKHDYLSEKRAALDAWALRLRSIIDPSPADNVLPLKGRARG